MNFRPDLAEAVMDGRKTVTRRLVSDNPRSPWWTMECAYKPGQIVAICPGRGKHNIGHARVTSVQRMHLRIDDREAMREGFANRGEFEAAWESINGSYDDSATVWRIGLEAVRP